MLIRLILHFTLVLKEISIIHSRGCWVHLFREMAARKLSDKMSKITYLVMKYTFCCKIFAFSFKIRQSVYIILAAHSSEQCISSITYLVIEVNYAQMC